MKGSGMRVNHKKVQEMATSWINGNLGYVRKEVKKLTKLEFYFLMLDICNTSNVHCPETLANNLVGNY